MKILIIAALKLFWVFFGTWGAEPTLQLEQNNISIQLVTWQMLCPIFTIVVLWSPLTPEKNIWIFSF